MTHSAGNRISAQILMAVLLCGVIGRPATAQPGPIAASVDLNAEQRALIAQLTADKAITVARERRIAEADQERLYEQLKAKGPGAAADREAGGRQRREAGMLGPLRADMLARVPLQSGHASTSGIYHFDRATPDRRVERRANP